MGYMKPQEDLARFVAAAEAALVDTDSADAVIEDPAGHVALGQVACARFSAVGSFDGIAADLGAGDATAAGAVIGAAVETICDEHSGRI